MSQPHLSEREDDKDRFVIFPGKHEDIWDCYKSLQENFWTLEEIDWHQDEIDQQKLSEKDKTNLQTALTTGILINHIIGKQLAKLLCRESLFAESRYYFSQQLAVLNSQSECFSHILQVLNLNTLDKVEISNFPTAEWLEEKCNSASYPETLMLLCLAEKLFYNKFFYQSTALKQRNLMPGLVFSSDLIARDKNLQTACLLKFVLKQQHDQLSIENTEKLLMDALELEKSTSSGYDKLALQNLAAQAAELLESLQEKSGEAVSVENKNLIQKRIATLKNSEKKKDHKIGRKTGF